MKKIREKEQKASSTSAAHVRVKTRSAVPERQAE